MVYAINIADPNVNPLAKFSNFSTLLNVILPIITAGASLVCLAIMLLSAYKIIVGGDNPETIKKSQAAIVYAGFGLVFVIASYLIVKLIGRILGVDIMGL
jgi:hypothetical protein